MPAEQAAIAENHVIGHVTVMSNMGIRHQKIAMANPGDTVFLVGAAVDGDPFTEKIVVANKAA